MKAMYLAPMGCRSFLSPWKDENGNYKFEGRFNQGVVSINLPQIAICARGNESNSGNCWMNVLIYVMRPYVPSQRVDGQESDVSPIHWQYGAIARLKKGENR